MAPSREPPGGPTQQAMASCEEAIEGVLTSDCSPVSPRGNWETAGLTVRPRRRTAGRGGAGTALRRQAFTRFMPSAQTTAGFNAMVSSRSWEKPACASAASHLRPSAAEVSSVTPGPRG
jgi:hypothetical protein